jgi:cellulose synthase/poly-beta-1,6-N-acetylglucosamine synthase-like glycosyltransferase
LAGLTEPHPACTVIVPTRSRPGRLSACLEALSRLDYPRDRYDVIVVDDGGEVPAAPVVEAFEGRLSATLLVQEHAGPGAARNTAAEHARGDLLVFTDDDCRPDASWLSHLMERFAAEPHRAFGGRTVNGVAHNLYVAVSQLVIKVGYAQNNRDPENAHFFASNNVAFPRRDFLALGGFDPSFTTSEDRELCSRWILSGRRMSYVPDAVVFHDSDLGLRSFWRQFFSYGRGAFRYRRVQARRTGRRVPIEPSFYCSLARRSFTDETVNRPVRAVALLAVWHAANTAGFLREWWSMRRDRVST